MNWLILILGIIWPTLEAVYEGLYDNGKKTISGIVELLHKLVVVGTTAFVTYGVTVGTIDTPIWKLILGFVFIRFLLFDYIYNITRKLPLGFIGTTKIYDRVMSKLGNWGTFIKICCGIVGTAFLLGLR
jgi:hypothetical protein